MKKSIAVNTMFNVAYKLLNMLFPLVTSVYLSRVLGPIYIGKVSYAQSVLSYFTVVAALGIPTYGMREIAKAGDNAEKRNKVFSELFLMNLISTLFCAAVYTGAIFVMSGMRAEFKLFLCVGLSLYMNVFNIDWFYSGQEEYVYITVRSLIVKLFSLLAILLLIKSTENYVRYALICSVATTGNYIWNVLNLRKRVEFQKRGLEFKSHIKPVLILLMTMLATDLYNQIDITMLGVFRTDAEVGYYSNGIKLVRMVHSITTAISATILPRMCLYFKEKREVEYKELFWRTFHIVSLLAVPCFVGIVLVADPLVLTMFGEAFAPTVTVIRSLSPIILIVSISYLVGSVVLTSSGNEKYLLKATISGSLVNVFLNSLLIPIFGTAGAAVASVIGETTVLGIHFYYGNRFVKRKMDLKFFISLGISTLLMACAVIGAQMMIHSNIIALFVSVAAGIVVYVVVLLITKNTIAMLFWDMLKRELKRGYINPTK